MKKYTVTVDNEIIRFHKESTYIPYTLHREDGPAVQYPDGTKEWYINGKQYSEEEYNKLIISIKNM